MAANARSRPFKAITSEQPTFDPIIQPRRTAANDCLMKDINFFKQISLQLSQFKVKLAGDAEKFAVTLLESVARNWELRITSSAIRAHERGNCIISVRERSRGLRQYGARRERHRRQSMISFQHHFDSSRRRP
jgi:hypothetical protein